MSWEQLQYIKEQKLIEDAKLRERQRAERAKQETLQFKKFIKTIPPYGVHNNVMYNWNKLPKIDIDEFAKHFEFKV